MTGEKPKPKFGPIEVTILLGVIALGLGSVLWAFFGPWSTPVSPELVTSCEGVCETEVACEGPGGDADYDTCVQTCIVQSRERFGGCEDEVVSMNECLAGLSCEELADEQSCQAQVEAVRQCRDGQDR